MKSNIRLNLTGLNPTALVALSKNVTTKMTGNTNFATPLIALKDISDQADALEIAIEEATDGSGNAKRHRDTLISELRLTLTSQADYVRGVCSGNKEMLGTSGFELAKSPEKLPIPSAPLIKEAKMTGRAGQVELKWISSKGAKMYQVWMTDTDPAVTANWQLVSVSTKVTTMVDNLESYKAFWFTVSAIGAAGESAKADPTIGRAA